MSEPAMYIVRCVNGVPTAVIPIPIGGIDCPEPQDAPRPVKTVAYATSQLDEMAKELRVVIDQRNGAREALGASDRELHEERAKVERLQADREALMDTIGRDAATCRDVTAERDRLRSERDALACAALGTDDKPGFLTFKGDVGAAIKSIRDLHARAENRRSTLNEIAAIVWPNTAPGETAYALADLVEAVRKMRAERDTLGRASLESDAESMRLTAERDAFQKRIDAARDRVRFIADSDDRDKLAAILEGRAPTTENRPRNRLAVYIPLIAFADRLADVSSARPVRVGVRLDPASWEAFLAEARGMARSDRADDPPLVGPIRMPTVGGEVVIASEDAP